MADAAASPIFTIFEDHLNQSADFSKTTRKALRSGLRRALRDLNAVDMTDSEALEEYRWHMKVGTRSIFDITWKYLTGALAPAGIVLAKSPTIRRKRFVHPLHEDVTLLSILADYDRLPGLTWGDMEAKAEALSWRVFGAARRIWDHQMAVLGPDGAYTAPEPVSTDPIIPSRLDREPMRAWRVRVIVNSRQKATLDYPVVKALGALTDAFAMAQLDGLRLRRLMDGLMAQREQLLSSTVAAGVLKKATALVQAGDTGAGLHVIEHELKLGR